MSDNLDADNFYKKKIFSSNINMDQRTKEKIRIEKFLRQNYPNKKLYHAGSPTKFYQQQNLKMIKEGRTDYITYTNNKVYDPYTKRLLNKHVYLTQKGTLRQKYKNNEQYNLEGDIFTQAPKYQTEIKKQVRKAETQSINKDIKIDFTLLNNKFNNLLSILNPTTKRYLIKSQDPDTGEFTNIWTLNSNVIQKLSELIEKGEVYENAVDLDSFRTIIYQFVLRRPMMLTILGNPPKKTQNNGAFFGFNHKLEGIDLSRYQLYTKHEEEEMYDDVYDENCLCHALKNADIDVTPIKHLVRNRHIPHKDLKVIAQTLNIYITLRYIKDEKKKNHYGDTSLKEIKIGNINNHYFLIEPTDYTSYSIKNFNEVKDKENFNKIVSIKKYNKKGEPNYTRKNNRNIDSYNLIKILYENKDEYLEPIKYHHNLYKSIYHEKVKEFGSLEYKEELNTQENPKPRESIGENLKTIFFDYETTTARNDGTEVYHKPYCLFSDIHKKGFWGEDSGKVFLNDICDKYGIDKNSEAEEEVRYKDPETGETSYYVKKSVELMMKGKKYVTLIAHNCGYDFRFLMKHLFYNLDTIEKNNGLMTASCLYYYKNKVIHIKLRDSLKMINMPLSKFGSCFNLKNEKEIMPYTLFTEENVNKIHISKKICLSHVKKEKLCEKEFMNNCKKWGCINDDDTINILKYSGKYCYMDCLTLRDGYNTFSRLVREATGQDINNYISLASMSNDYLIRQGCYEGVNMISGVPRHFIQKCVVGGRTMTADNKKHRKMNCKISDFDAVSLYPSAMNRMRGFLKGSPKVIKNFNDIKNTADGYFIQLLVKKVNKKYHFPLASILTDKGIRNFTNDLEGEIIYLDKTGLEDVTKFMKIEYEFIKGYYYDEGVNDKIKDTMRHLFNQRLKYKKEKNPIQMVFKELMNSSYGKSFMKPIDSDKEYIQVKKVDDYINLHYNSIKTMVLCDNKKLFKVEKIKSIDTHFNNVHCGVEILSMSKRIMNEVMTLAEDLNYQMYITDTDSIHIDSDNVKPLGDEFKKRYNRDLIGKDMGQFHTDFDMEGAYDEIHAIDSVFLGKKCYCDRLKSKDKKGNDIYDYHVRMKGIPNDCIIHKANEDFNGDVIALYNYLYDNPEGLEFNLLAVKPKFEFTKDMMVKNKTKFNRRVRFL